MVRLHPFRELTDSADPSDLERTKRRAAPARAINRLCYDLQGDSAAIREVSDAPLNSIPAHFE